MGGNVSFNGLSISQRACIGKSTEVGSAVILRHFIYSLKNNGHFEF
jgi:hypothetical protein